jgi:hypothetical protein
MALDAADTVPRAEAVAMDPSSRPVAQRVALLVKALNGAKRTNEALARCSDGEAMLEVLLDASRKLSLGLSRRDLLETPPIRDWIWWKNKEALLTIGDNKPRYQQDGGQGRPGRGTSPPVSGDDTSAVVPVEPQAPQEPRRRFLGLF